MIAIPQSLKQKAKELKDFVLRKESPGRGWHSRAEGQLLRAGVGCLVKWEALAGQVLHSESSVFKRLTTLPFLDLSHGCLFPHTSELLLLPLRQAHMPLLSL